jgi:hypothetical protein
MSDHHPQLDIWEEPLPPAEFDRLVQKAIADLDGPEGDEMAAFMEWFTRRYPTPLERLRYTTRKYREWSRTRGILANPR